MMLLVHHADVSVWQLRFGLQIQALERCPPWSQHHVYLGAEPLLEIIL